MLQRKNYVKGIFFLLWIAIIGFCFYTFIQTGTSLKDTPKLIATQVRSFGIWAPLIFILLFAIRPLIFFPATILSLSAGLLFGAYKALIILIIAENLSTLVSYSVGRYFGKSLLSSMDREGSYMNTFKTYFQKNEFVSILTLRLLYAPFDFVGYAAGATGVDYKAFAGATFIGILPGLITSAFLSSSLYDPRNLFISGTFFVLGFIISKYVKKQHEKNM